MTGSQGIHSLADYLDEQALAEALSSSLRNTLFSSSLSVSPRQVNTIASGPTSGFFTFFGDRDGSVADTYGRQLAQAGVGHRSILAMTETLRQECYQKANPSTELPAVAGLYVNALLEGYMAGREELVLQEQQRTVQAYIRASAQREDETG